MQQVTIDPGQAGQRLDKYLRRLLPNAPDSFLYKMLRKKNITLNGKKAEGREILQDGDEVRLYFSDDTYGKFAGNSVKTDAQEERGGESASSYIQAYRRFRGIRVVYEDSHVLILNKPAGLLSQKAQAGDLSLNEWMIGYLLQNGAVQEKDLAMFHPSVCNRLDRNTSGLVLCGKTLAGSQALSMAIQGRTVRKFYRTIVLGSIREPGRLEGYLIKDAKNNRVHILSRNGSGKESSTDGRNGRSGVSVLLAYQPLRREDGLTYLEVELITGKSHQIRAQLSEAGYPLLGDYKYGSRSVNDRYKAEYGLESQILHAYRLEFPSLEGALKGLGGKTVEAPMPPIFSEILGD